MRIGIDARVLSGEIKGIGRYLEHLLSTLVSVNGKHEYILFYDAKQPRKIPLLLNGSVTEEELSAPNDELWEQWSVRRAIRKHRLDVFHSPANTTLLWPVCPTVVTLHDAMSHRYATNWGRRENFYWNYIQRNAYRKSSCFIAPSEFAKNQLVNELSIAPEQIRVIHHGISHHYQKASSEVVKTWRQKFGIERPYIFVAGGRLKRKNIPTAIQAFNIVARQLENIDLVVSGVEGVPAVQEAVEQSQNSGRIYLIPHLGQDDLIAAYSGAELFVFPSLEETFGFPPVEAMACGAPVVASNATCIPEVLGEAAYFVDTKESEPFAQAIVKVLKNNSLRAGLVKKGIERARQFRWEKTARETLAVYEEATRS